MMIAKYRRETLFDSFSPIPFLNGKGFVQNTSLDHSDPHITMYLLVTAGGSILHWLWKTLSLEGLIYDDYL